MRTGYHEIDDDTPITPEAQRWAGWGTALKPAHEPFVIARKPLRGSVAENVRRYGTGAINIAACRVGTETIKTQGDDKFPGVYGTYATCPKSMHVGRWPANIAHDGSDEVLSLFPMTNGSAARYFYCAKASPADRDDGCEGLEERLPVGGANKWTEQDKRRGEGVTRAPSRNHHPTVKPTELMRYLCRLVAAPGALILDPYCGSGSTGRAAALEGVRFIGIEINPEYCAIARKRIAAAVGAVARTADAAAELWPAAQPLLVYAPPVAPPLRPKPKPRAVRDAAQPGLFDTEEP